MVVTKVLITEWLKFLRHEATAMRDAPPHIGVVWFNVHSAHDRAFFFFFLHFGDTRFGAYVFLLYDGEPTTSRHGHADAYSFPVVNAKERRATVYRGTKLCKNMPAICPSWQTSFPYASAVVRVN